MNDMTVCDGGIKYTIRYDGMDANERKIELSQLGISIQGFARILSVIAHFSQTGNYVKQYDALSVKVFAVPTEEHHCFEMVAFIGKILGSEYLWSGTGGAVLAAGLGYLFSKKGAEEMKHLSEALKQSMSQNEETTKKLINIIEKMTAGLNSSAKQALSPINNTCDSISVYQDNELAVKLDQKTKDRFYDEGEKTIQPTQDFTGIISELDMDKGTCKVALNESNPEKRTNAIISDPLLHSTGNQYVTSMGKREPLTFRAKAEINEDGNIVKLYISDTV